MSTQDEAITTIAAMVQSCHSILNTAWPRPGRSDLKGASVFIGTRLFTALRNGMEQVGDRLREPAYPLHEGSLGGLWQNCTALVGRLSKIERESKTPEVDEAFNLLYFATGVFYNRLVATSRIPIPTDSRFSECESLTVLVEICEWRLGTENILADTSKELARMLGELG